MLDQLTYEPISAEAAIQKQLHGGRAKCLQRLVRLGMPVPESVGLSIPMVRAIAAGQRVDLAPLLDQFGSWPVLSVRSSPIEAAWGGPGTVLNVGMNRATEAYLASKIGGEAASELHLRFIRSYAVEIARLEDEIFDIDYLTPERALEAFEEEMEEPFPQDIEVQLFQVLKSMARAWDGTTARLLRKSRGAPEDAGLGLVVQRMVFGRGRGASGSGVIQFVCPDSGDVQITGRYMEQSQGRDALSGGEALFLAKDERGPSLEERQSDVYQELLNYGEIARRGLRDEMQIEFTIDDGKLYVLDAVNAGRNSRAGVAIAVRLAESEVISPDDALLRIDPQAISELLHRQVAPGVERKVLTRAIAASPGAATGKIVFNAVSAQAADSQGEASILVRRETAPEDIRGMHAASGILTERGGTTSHAAVIARGLGLPCVSGAADLAIDTKAGTLTLRSGQVLQEGDIITLDGTSGEVLEGAVELVEAGIGGEFRQLMSWADKFRDIKVRANADTPEDAELASLFEAEGIGLCRTEHMFFATDRLSVLREAIFAEREQDVRAALDRLLPMQREDFAEMFCIMPNKPVCLRLFDPPLHEFLPNTRSGVREMAEAVGLSVRDVQRRVDSFAEFNPILGLRGVRLGITSPEIYDMQARAIFEAALLAEDRIEVAVSPEIMIPLVSTKREVELVKARIDAVASEVATETGRMVDYRLGVMVETPRAALRAGDIATHCTFLSFGTNDMTQMTYGLSRDDSGRFMSDYVNKGVFPEDPFHALDIEGVGELLELAAERARKVREKVSLAVCGEHGGDPDSIAFCRALGMEYVSVSPYRVPIARLASAQLAILSLRDVVTDSEFSEEDGFLSV